VRQLSLIGVFAAAALCASLVHAQARGVDAKRLLDADSEPGQWMSTGRTYDEQRFSPLQQITADNVARLGLAWFADLDTNRGQEATPIVVDGVIYIATAWSKVKAYDARTGKALWDYDPKVPGEWGVRGCCDVVNRGVAFWKGKVYVGTYDGRLVALDAGTGTVKWETNTIDRSKPYTITGAPRIVKGKVLIGNGGAEFGVRGYVSAYDAETGKLDWRFYTVPGNPADPFEAPILAAAAKTWKGEWWKLGGGGTVWDSMAYDPKLDLLYIGVGNGTPWNQTYRSPGGGDNLFLSSIVALDPDDGNYVWHYQQTPGETWDYTATQHIIVADLPIDGRQRRVVMQAPKNGFFYVLDAANGKLISAKNYTTVSWATGVDPQTGRPLEVPEARWEITGKPFIMQPGPQGAHSWHPMSFNPQTGYVYLPVVENSMAFLTDPNFKPREMATNLGMQFPVPPGLYEQLKSNAPRESSAFLVAWDPVANREVWRSSPRGRVGSGILSTAGGLVFQGSPGGEFVAYRASNGERLWVTQAQTGVVAAPVSYELDGQQYIAQVAGFGTSNYYLGNRSRLLVFKLDGTAALPPEPPPPPPPVLNPPPQTASAEAVAQGQQTFSRYCAMCHDTPGANRGLFPDLRYSAMLNSAEAFHSVVIDGALQPRGMVSFKQVLSAEDAQTIRHYLISRAHEAKAAPAPR
jgi:quinohemoprotein ethanol dehydrogenase